MNTFIIPHKNETQLTLFTLRISLNIIQVSKNKISTTTNQTNKKTYIHQTNKLTNRRQTKSITILPSIEMI